MVEYYENEAGKRFKLGDHKGAWKPSEKPARELLEEYRDRMKHTVFTGDLIWRQRIYVACHRVHGFVVTCVEPEVWHDFICEYKAERSWKTSDERRGN